MTRNGHRSKTTASGIITEKERFSRAPSSMTHYSKCKIGKALNSDQPPMQVQLADDASLLRPCQQAS
jgi:hypothetical protein